MIDAWLQQPCNSSETCRQTSYDSPCRTIVGLSWRRGYDLNSSSERELCCPPKPQPPSSTTGRCLAKAGIAAGIASDKPAQARHEHASGGNRERQAPCCLAQSSTSAHRHSIWLDVELKVELSKTTSNGLLASTRHTQPIFGRVPSLDSNFRKNSGRTMNWQSSTFTPTIPLASCPNPEVELSAHPTMLPRTCS